ncbi:CRAL TRIO domain containing protein, partial [Asbolus verrucosus]
MPFQVANAETLYAKDVILKQDDVNAALEWLKKQPHLPQLTELQVILFLHSCYYRIEAMKTAIDNYFSIRTHCPEVFACASEAVIRRTLSVATLTMLPKKTKDGCVIMSMKLLDFKPENHISLEHIKVATMIMSLYFHQYGPANGLIAVFDTKGATLGHLTRINLIAFKQLLYFVQEAAPTRIRGVHFINVNPITNKLVVLAKPFLKKEIYEMIKFHSGSFENFYNYVPKEFLPEDYGGELPSCQTLHEKNLENLLNNLDFFKWHDAQTVDETKRYEKAKNIDVEEKYAQDAKLKREDAQAVFQWLKKQPHLPELTELQVLLFLHSCHYRIEAAKVAIDNYFTIREHCPDLFACASEEVVRQTLAVESMTILPRLTFEGYVILSTRLIDYRPEKYICIDHLKVVCMVLTLYLHQHGPVNGVNFHSGSLDTLYKYIPKECLPEDYGGELPSFQILH